MTAAEPARLYISSTGSDANSGISPDSPYQSFDRVLSALASIPKPWTSDVMIHVIPRDYVMKSTIQPGEKHCSGGERRIVFRNHGELGSAVLLGGQQLDPKRWVKGEEGWIQDHWHSKEGLIASDKNPLRTKPKNSDSPIPCHSDKIDFNDASAEKEMKKSFYREGWELKQFLLTNPAAPGPEFDPASFLRTSLDLIVID